MKRLSLPPEVDQALRDGAALAISISGGKDSQAMLLAVLEERKRQPDWTGPVYAIHADLGRVEWTETPAAVEALAAAVGVELVVVRRTKGDLLQRWTDRMEQLDGTGKPFWSSAAARYCTSDLKRDPINKHIRRHRLVVSAEGIRREESAARARKACWEPRKRIITETRHAITWRPILDWTEADVWEACGVSLDEVQRRRWLYRAGLERLALDGWPCHPAYVYGNERLSCALCVLASVGDLRNGARHHPELYATLVDMEERSGFSFQPSRWLRDLFASSDELAA